MEKKTKDATQEEMMLRPALQATRTIVDWQTYSDADPSKLREALEAQITDLEGGSLSRPEAMLLMQTHTLDTLFNTLAQKARIQEHLPNYEAFMRMALRTQNQCRMTVETLANIKNPPIIYAKQANFSGGGHQQVNNGVPVPPQAQEIKNQQNEKLSEAHYVRATMDTHTTSTAIPVNTQLEAVGDNQGRTNTGRQGQLIT